MSCAVPRPRRVQMAQLCYETTAQGVVVLDYADLVAKKDLRPAIEAAYGLDGLGMLCVKNIPNFVSLRETLLKIPPRFQALPASAKKRAMEARLKNKFLPGWYESETETRSTYYCNPQYDVPTQDGECVKLFPETAHPNVWPGDDFPSLEPVFKEVGQLVIRIGTLVAHQCDEYARTKLGADYSASLESLLQNSRSCKGLLMHYLPLQDVNRGANGERSHDSWFHWHKDFSCLTALLPAMYLGPDGHERACPDAEAGLWIRNRAFKEFRVRIPLDQLVLQLGESSQVLSGGVLRATPHAVEGVAFPEAKETTREAFSVFLQPNFDYELKLPKGRTTKDANVLLFEDGMRFGHFCTRSFARGVDYGKKDAAVAKNALDITAQ